MKNKQTEDSADKKIILAIDSDNIDYAYDLVAELHPHVGMIKVNMAFLLASYYDAFFAPKKVRIHTAKVLRKFYECIQGKMFFDVKLHEIPSIMGLASRIIADINPVCFTVHLPAGVQAMHEVTQNKKRSHAIAVTCLTSLSDYDTQQFFGQPRPALVAHLSKLAALCELDGIVCSAADAWYLNTVYPKYAKTLLTIVPGIAPRHFSAWDQKNHATPTQAITAGADYIVIGRAITGAADPVAMCNEIKAEIADAISFRNGGE